MGRTAAAARPGTDAERHRFGEGAAVRAQPGGGKPAVDRDHLAPAPGGLVLQHAPELRRGKRLHRRVLAQQGHEPALVEYSADFRDVFRDVKCGYLARLAKKLVKVNPCGKLALEADPPWRRIGFPVICSAGIRLLSALKSGVSTEEIR